MEKAPKPPQQSSMDSTRVTIRERHLSAKEHTPLLKRGWGRKVIAGIIVGGLTLLGLKIFGQPGAVGDEVIVAGATLLGIFGVVAGEYGWHFMRGRGNVLASRLSTNNQSTAEDRQYQEDAYRQLNTEKRILQKQIGELQGELQKEWRAARQAFESEYTQHQNRLSPFLTTVKNLLIASGRRQVTSPWNEYLPVPPEVDDDLYYLFAELWTYGWPELLDEANLDRLKATFHSIYGFFDRVYDLLEDFPEHAPVYVDRNVKPDQYDALHVVWHLGHALNAVLHGNQKADKPPSRWDRLWRKWNIGVMIPSDPTMRITPSTPDSGEPPDPGAEEERP